MIKEQKYKKAIEIINQEFQSLNIKERISLSDVLIGDQTVAESIKEIKNFGDHVSPIFNNRISNIIFNHYYPEPKNTTFYHFTTFDNFKSILLNDEIWLFSLTKRFEDEEYRLFYIDHQMYGYKERTESDKKMEIEIMEGTYYSSFTRAAEIDNEESFWNSFGDKGSGVRLEFEIKPKMCDFRNVYYECENDSKLLLHNINVKLKKELEGRVLLIPGLSKIGAFYIKGDFETETESRLIIKKVSDSYNFDFKEFQFNKSVKYIKLKFESPFASIQLLSVKAGKPENRQKIEEIVREKSTSIKVI